MSSYLTSKRILTSMILVSKLHCLSPSMSLVNLQVIIHFIILSERKLYLTSLQILYSLSEFEISEIGITGDTRMLSHAIAMPFRNGGYTGKP